MNSMELSNYLEKIRYGRKLSQEDFVFGIVSIRQYQRYRRGESEIPYEKLDQFAEKLGIPTKKLMAQFETEKNRQLNKVNEYYNSVATRNFKIAQKLYDDIKFDIIIDKETKVYFHHARLFHQFYEGKISKEILVPKTQKLINYPEILKQEYFTDIEILIMSSMLDFLELPKQDLLLRRLGELFEQSDNILSSQNDMTNSLILMRLSNGYGMQGEFEKTIHFADLGIQRGIKFKQYYLFENFFYYKALAHFKLEQYLEYEETLFRCYNVLQMEGNKRKIDRFTELIEKDFKINFHMFVMKYLQKEIM